MDLEQAEGSAVKVVSLKSGNHSAIWKLPAGHFYSIPNATRYGE